MLEFFKSLLGMNNDAAELRKQSARMVQSATAIADDFEAIADASRQFRDAALPVEIGEYVDAKFIEAKPAVKGKRKVAAK